MKPALLIATGPNEGTLSNVLFAVQQRNKDMLRIEKVLVLDVEDEGMPSQSLSYEQLVECGKRALGNDATTEWRKKTVSGDLQRIIPRILVDGAKEVGRDNLIVDITSGNKTASSILYASASFSRLDHIYYISVQRVHGRHAELWKENSPSEFHTVVNLAPLRDVKELAALSHFDLIFYLDSLVEIDSAVSPDISAGVHEATHHLRSALRLFFELRDNLAAMQAVGTTSEHLIGILIAVVNLIDSEAQVNTLGELRRWCEQLRDELRSRNGPDFTRHEVMTQTLDHSLELLRVWRNASKHTNPPDFKDRDVRTALNVALNLLEASVRLTQGGA